MTARDVRILIIYFIFLLACLLIGTMAHAQQTVKPDAETLAALHDAKAANSRNQEIIRKATDEVNKKTAGNQKIIDAYSGLQARKNPANQPQYQGKVFRLDSDLEMWVEVPPAPKPAAPDKPAEPTK